MREHTKREGSIHDLNSAPAAPGVLAEVRAELQHHNSPRTSLSPKHRIKSPAASLGKLRIVKSSSSANLSNIFVDDNLLLGESESEDEGDKLGGLRRGSAPARLDDLMLQPRRQKLDEGDRSGKLSNNILFKSFSAEGLDDFDDDDEEEDNGDDGGPDSEGDDSSDGAASVLTTLFGMNCTAALCRNRGYSRMSAFVVRNAPCFWFCGKSLDIGATDRSVLYRLNILCSFFALGQIASAVFLIIVLYSDLIVNRDDESVNREDNVSSAAPNLWNLNGSILLVGVLAAVIFATMIVTLKVIREVNLRGAIRYMWTMVWIFPLQIFFVISLFDYHQVTDVWVRHWWSLPSMAYFRGLFCAPGTANTLCNVPVGGGNVFPNGTEYKFANESVWCQLVYDATNCTEIRDEAQQDMMFFSYLFYNVNGVWALLLVILLLLSINVLEGIITKPIVQKSRESNVPAWLTFPIVGCSVTGAFFLFSPSSAMSVSSSNGWGWIAVLYIFCGVSFFIAALLGWFISTFSILNSRDKRTKNIAVLFFIGFMVVTTLLVGAIFAGSILISTSLIDVPLTDSERGVVACVIDTAESCSFCGNQLGLRECPEWSDNEVTKILQTQLKQSATLAAIFILYSMGALRFGFVLRKHISMYQIDYV